MAVIACGASGRCDSIRLIGSDAAGAGKSTYAFMHDLINSPESATEPRLMGDAARLLTISATVPNIALLDPTIEDRHDAHLRTLRRAIAFIEANPDLDLIGWIAPRPRMSRSGRCDWSSVAI
jgi:hypothetical protein